MVDQKMADRLARARKAAGYETQRDAAEALGVREPTYRSHENGGRGFARSVEKYARKFKVRVEWLLSGTGDMKPGGDTYRESLQDYQSSDIVFPDTVEISGEDYRPLPVYDMRASAGPGALNHEGEPMSYAVFNDNYLRRVTRAKPDQLAIIEVHGDSMWPTLHSGDQVLIDTSQTMIRAPGIYAIDIDGDVVIKRGSRHPVDKVVTIASDNEAYPPYEISEQNAVNLRVLGKAVWTGRMLA